MSKMLFDTAVGWIEKVDRVAVAVRLSEGSSEENFFLVSKEEAREHIELRRSLTPHAETTLLAKLTDKGTTLLLGSVTPVGR